jgi:hypothetical protein
MTRSEPGNSMRVVPAHPAFHFPMKSPLRPPKSEFTVGYDSLRFFWTPEPSAKKPNNFGAFAEALTALTPRTRCAVGCLVGLVPPGFLFQRAYLLPKR